MPKGVQFGRELVGYGGGWEDEEKRYSPNSFTGSTLNQAPFDTECLLYIYGFRVVVGQVLGLAVDQQRGSLGGGGHWRTHPPHRSTISASTRPTMARNPSTSSRATLCQGMFNLAENWWSYGGVVYCPPPPLPATPIGLSILAKSDILWHRVGLLYVDRFRVIVGLFLALVVDRRERVCPPPPPT